MSNDSSMEQNNETKVEGTDETSVKNITETIVSNNATKKSESSEATSTINIEEKLIYLGPPLPKEGLKRFCVYKNGLPESVKNIFNIYPDAERLFVKVENISKVLNAIENKGSSYHTWYEKLIGKERGV